MLGKTRFRNVCDPAAREAMDNLLKECPSARERCEGVMNAVMGCFTWQMLAAHPEYIRRAACTGKDLADYADRHPDGLALCDWNKLDDKDWREFLLRHPECLSKCECQDELSGGTWLALLSEHPELEDVAHWETLGGCHWATLICRHEGCARHCLWDRLRGVDWAAVLRKHPQFADRCRWEKLSGRDWACVLVCQPQFAERCDWTRLTEADWKLLLKSQPQFFVHWKASGIKNEEEVRAYLEGRFVDGKIVSARDMMERLSPWTSGRRMRRLGGTCMGY